MTFWQLVWEHKVKIMGILSAVLMQLMSMAASGQLDMLIPMAAVAWIGVVGSLLGVAITAAGFANTTTIRVAEAESEVARTMRSAIAATPGPKPTTIAEVTAAGQDDTA